MKEHILMVTLELARAQADALLNEARLSRRHVGAGSAGTGRTRTRSRRRAR